MAGSSTVIQQLIPALGASLARLRRTPGRNGNWTEDVLRALERMEPARYERLRRRIGFGRRLGDLAGLAGERASALALAIFFHELVEGQEARGRSGSANVWADYLLRNEEWLAPALEMCQTVYADGWELPDDQATIVAKVTLVFDAETLEHHERPLQATRFMLAEAQSPEAEEVIQLLLTEDGQELCDHHFRRHPSGYRLDAAELRRCFNALHRRAPKPAVEDAAVAPLRLSGTALRTPAEQPKARAARPSPVPAAPPPGRSNFDQRREALRSRSAAGRDEPASDDEPLEDTRTEFSEEPAAAPEPTPVQERWPTPLLPASANGEAAARDIAEEEAMQMHTIAAVPPARRDTLGMIQKLQDLRLQLGQIQRSAQAAEQLLTGLAPQLDELATWIADLEAVVGRWQERPNIGRAA